MFGKILKKIDTVITNIEEWSLFIMVIVSLLSLFANVVLRYGFNYTLAWSEELVRIVIIYTTFMGASVAVKQRAMIKIDAVVHIFPKLKSGLTFFSNILMLIFAGMMVYYGYKIARLLFLTNQKTVIMQIPFVFIYSILPFMGVMVFIRTCQVIIQDVQTGNTKK